MNTSYLLAYYTLDGQISLSSSINIKTGLFLLDFPLYHYSNFWYQKLLLLWKIEQKSGESKNKLRKIYPNNNEKF